MTYTVAWKELASGVTIRTEDYEHFDEAMSEADVVMMGGPRTVVVSISNGDGVVLSTRVFDGS